MLNTNKVLIVVFSLALSASTQAFFGPKPAPEKVEQAAPVKVEEAQPAAVIEQEQKSAESAPMKQVDPRIEQEKVRANQENSLIEQEKLRVDDENARLDEEKANQEKAAQLAKENEKKKAKAAAKKAEQEKVLAASKAQTKKLEGLSNDAVRSTEDILNEATWPTTRAAYAKMLSIDPEAKDKVTIIARDELARRYAIASIFVVNEHLDAGAKSKSNKETDILIDKMPNVRARAEKLQAESNFYVKGLQKQKESEQTIAKFNGWYVDAMAERKKRDDDNILARGGQGLANGVKSVICLFSCDSFKKDDEQ